ncbi:unnamed protein product, partial [Darwinula stevensoni]
MRGMRKCGGNGGGEGSGGGGGRGALANDRLSVAVIPHSVFDCRQSAARGDLHVPNRSNDRAASVWHSILTVGGSQAIEETPKDDLDEIVSYDVYSHVLVAMQYFFPLTVISAAYLRIGCRLWGAQMPGNAEDHRDALLLKNKKKSVKYLTMTTPIRIRKGGSFGSKTRREKLSRPVAMAIGAIAPCRIGCYGYLRVKHVFHLYSICIPPVFHLGGMQVSFDSVYDRNRLRLKCAIALDVVLSFLSAIGGNTNKREKPVKDWIEAIRKGCSRASRPCFVLRGFPQTSSGESQDADVEAPLVFGRVFAEDRGSTRSRTNEVIKMLAIVVALFAICWLPLQTYYIVAALHSEVNS